MLAARPWANLRYLLDTMLMQKYKDILILLGVGLFILYDLVEDSLEHRGLFSAQTLIEAMMLLGLFVLVRSNLKRIGNLETSLKTEKERVNKLSGELSAHIQKQFNDWSLSSSEQEIAWLMIKGYAFAEIAEVRGVKDKTVRQQATNIYAKTDIGNRSEFSAWFIEDLLQASEKSTIH